MASETETFGESGGERRSWISAIGRGFRKRCPECGRGQLFASYSKTFESCDQCGLELSGHRADDAPPYVTILIVGHIVIPVALAVRQMLEPPLWAQFAVWTPIIVLATFWLLPLSKGALIGVQWANRMHGFAGPGADPDADA